MRKPIIGATVGTSISPKRVENDIKPVKTINNVNPDENGNVELELNNIGAATTEQVNAAQTTANEAKAAASSAGATAANAMTAAMNAQRAAGLAQAAADSKAPLDHTHTKSQITDFPTSMTPTAHNHSVNDVTGAAKLQSPNDMLHNGNEFTFIPAGHSGELYINHRTASGATDGNISNYHFCDGKGGEATLIANYFKGKFQGKDARPIYNNEEVAMLSDVPSKTETWTFTLEDGSTVTKAVYVG